MNKDEKRKKLKEIMQKAINECKDLIEKDKDDETQILTILYDTTGHMKVGWGCLGCAVDAAIRFIERNRSAEHNEHGSQIVH